MTPEEEAVLARLITQDVQQLKDRTSEAGVLAYARQPVPRDRLNERFLQNTLRNLGQANRRADEQAMWASRQRQLELDDPATSRPSKRHRDDASPDGASSASNPPSSASATSSDQIGPAHRQSDLSDEDLADLLASKGVRGRGGIGSRAEETGPYLPGHLAGEARIVGPARPPWLQSDEDASDVAASALQAERWLAWQQQQQQQQSHGLEASTKPAKHKKAKKGKKAKHKDGKHRRRRKAE